MNMYSGTFLARYPCDFFFGMKITDYIPLDYKRVCMQNMKYPYFNFYDSVIFPFFNCKFELLIGDSTFSVVKFYFCPKVYSTLLYHNFTQWVNLC